MPTRRYFRSSIEELKQLFGSSTGDHTVLNELRDELSHRDRPRAKALAKKVADQLAVLEQSKSADKPATPKQATPSARVPEVLGTEIGRAHV